MKQILNSNAENDCLGKRKSNMSLGDVMSGPEFLALYQESRILRHSSNPACGFSMLEQVRLCAVWPMENLALP